VVASGGYHCSDLVMAQGIADDSVRTVQELGAGMWLLLDAQPETHGI
jgi:hypothetical protein